MKINNYANSISSDVGFDSYVPVLPTQTQEEKLEAAKEYLGENWVLHPNYKPNPKHNLTNRKVGESK